MEEITRAKEFDLAEKQTVDWETFGQQLEEADKIEKSVYSNLAEQRRQQTDHFGDTVNDVQAGVLGAGRGLVGLADLVTPGQLGKVVDEYTPLDEWEEQVESQYSPARQQAQADYANAEGVTGKIGEIIKNPSLATSAAIQSAPSMLAGGGVAKAGAGILSRGAKYLPQAAYYLSKLKGVSKSVSKIKKALGKNAGAITRGAVSEGLISAGQQAEDIRSQTDTGETSATQDIIAAVTGAGTAAFGALGGRVAQKLGLADPDILAAGGDVVGAAVKKGMPRRAAETAFVEGIFEELPQSAQEQMLNNIALDRPVTEGLEDAVVMGTAAGGVMGGATGMVFGGGKSGDGFTIADDPKNPAETKVQPEQSEAEKQWESAWKGVAAQEDESQKRARVKDSQFGDEIPGENIMQATQRQGLGLGPLTAPGRLLPYQEQTVPQEQPPQAEALPLSMSPEYFEQTGQMLPYQYAGNISPEQQTERVNTALSEKERQQQSLTREQFEEARKRVSSSDNYAQLREKTMREVRNLERKKNPTKNQRKRLDELRSRFNRLTAVEPEKRTKADRVTREGNKEYIPVMKRKEFRDILPEYTRNSVSTKDDMGMGSVVNADERGHFGQRTPSTNPAWAQDAIAVAGSVPKLRNAVEKAANGEPLGENQRIAVEIVADAYRDERNQGRVGEVLQRRTDTQNLVRTRQAAKDKPSSQYLEMDEREQAVYDELDSETKTLHELTMQAYDVADENSVDALLESDLSDGEIAAELYNLIERKSNGRQSETGETTDRQAETAQGPEAGTTERDGTESAEGDVRQEVDPDQFPDATKMIETEQATEATAQPTADVAIEAGQGQRSESAAPDFEEMVKEAARWRGAALNHASNLDEKGKYQVSKRTTKGDLDAYLMRKYGIDETEARDVSNALTQRNLEDDRTADPADYTGEEWYKVGNSIPVQQQETPAASGETSAQTNLPAERMKFIERKVDELGSIEAVDKKYTGDAKIDRYARDYAREVFGEPSRKAKQVESKPAQETKVPETATQEEKPAQESRADQEATKKPSNNTIFTEDAAERARQKIRQSLSRTNSGFDPELAQAGLTLAGYHIEKGARTFAAYAKAMVEDMGDMVRPHLKAWYMAVKYEPSAAEMHADMDSAATVESAEIDDILKVNGGEDVTDERTPGSVERDSRDAGTGDEVGARGVSPNRGVRDSATGGQGVRSSAEQGDSAENSGGVPGRETPAPGKRGNQQAYPADGSVAAAQRTPGGNNGERGGDVSFVGSAVDPVATEAVGETATKGREKAETAKQQKQAEHKRVKLADRENIAETLPALYEEQQDDVYFAEQRFAKPKGTGVLFANGTGTGKTFTGLGIIKRFSMRGKDNILIVVPNAKLIDDWIESGKTLNLDIKRLKDTKDNGNGIVVTTYANMGANNSLAEREWDLVVPDEADNLMSNKDGKETSALATLRAITANPRGAYDRFRMLHRDKIAERDQLKESMQSNRSLYALDDTTDMQRADLEKEYAGLKEEYDALQKELGQANNEIVDQIKNMPDEQRTRVAFLSATPIPYEKNVDYLEGYLFDYPEDGYIGNSRQGGFEKFMVENFGYRVRYHKLTEPDKEVDRGLMQRMFNTRLRKEGVLSTRMLSVDKDYDRRFVLTENAIGSKIDDGLQFLWDNEQYRPLADIINKRFDYLSRRYLLESIKARESVPLIKDHLKKGRKVVVFHDYKKGGGFNPFDLGTLRNSKEEITNTDMTLGDLVRQFEAERPDLQQIDFSDLLSAVGTFSREFGDELLIVNGDFKERDNLDSFKRFNDENSGPLVMLVQSAKNAGWSGHDTTGKYQRVMFNLGLPERPTMAIQQEGRIYRVGQASNAIFRYLNTGTNWERIAFAQTIAQRSSTAENLAMGEEARALMDGFIEAFEESDSYPAGHPGEGTGGKERDAAANAVLTEWDRAMSLYYSQLKRNSKSKAQEGLDYFATPEPLGLKMVEWADIRGGEDVLEPSAGHGAIARWIPENVDATIVEPSLELSSKVRMVAQGKHITDTFENLHKVNKYDAIVMNPPFGKGGKTAIEHLDKATNHLRDGGRVVAIIPSGPAADKRFDKWFYAEDEKGKSLTPDLSLRAEISLPSSIFERAGTSVKARIVVIDKGSESTETATRDYSSATGVKEFFERIEDSSIPERTKAKPAEEAIAPQAEGSESGFKLAQTTHAKKGIDLYVATNIERVPYEEYKRLNSIAKKHNGYYSKFSRNGAVPGFQFESEQDRAEFLKEAGQEQLQSRSAQKTNNTPAQVEKEAKSFLGKGFEKMKQAGALKVVQSLDEVPGSGMFSELILPLHEVRDTEKVDALAEAMSKSGWVGRPVVVVGEQAITGTHRLAAAEKAGIDPETYEIEPGVLTEDTTREEQQAWEDLVEGDDESRLDAAKVLNRLGILDEEAVTLIEQEVEGNFSDFQPLYSQNGDIAGVYKDGQITLVADQIAKGETAGLLKHEGLHLLLRNDPTFKKRKGEIMRQFKNLKNTPKVKEAYAVVPKETDQNVRDEEALAYLVQNHKEHSLVKRIISAVKAWMFRNGIPVTKLTEGDLTALAAQGIKRFSKAQTIEQALAQADAMVGSEQPVFSRKRVRGTEAIEKALRETQAVPKDEMSWHERVQDWMKGISENFNKENIRQSVFDEYASVERAEKQKYGKLLDADFSPSKALRATKNLDSVMAAIFMKGKIRLNKNGWTELVDPENGKGFLKIFEPLFQYEGGSLTRLWEGYAGARRAKELKAQNRENNYSDEQIKELMKLEREYDGTNGKPDFKAIFDEYQAFNKSILDFAESAGVIDPESRKLWESNDYIPMYRILDDMDDAKGPMKKGGVASQTSGIRKLKGGVSKHGGVMENMVMNMTKLVDASYKNIGAERAIDLGLETGHAEAVAGSAANMEEEQIREYVNGVGLDYDAMDESQQKAWRKTLGKFSPEGGDIVHVLKGGKRKYYRVNDPLFLRSLQSVGGTDSNVLKLFRMSKSLLTNTVTANPSFMVANYLRDSLSTWLVTGTKMFPVFSGIKQGMKAWNEDAMLWQMMAAGAGGGRFYNTRSKDVRKMANQIEKKMKDKGFAETVLDSPGKIWQFWQKMGNVSENANRLAVMQDYLNRGYTQTEAAYQAMDVMNFTRHGDGAIMKFMMDTVPFLNARIQGLDRVYRGAKANPGTFAMRGAMLGMASLALYMANKDREEYDDLPEWDKDIYWHFFTPAGHYRFPKPFEVGAIFGMLPERIAEAISKGETRFLADAAKRAVMDTLAFDPMPQLVRPAYEIAIDRNRFFDMPIVGFDKYLEPEAQYNTRTPVSYVKLAEAMPDIAPDFLRSPKQLEHLVRGYTSSVGSIMFWMADRMMEQAGMIDKKETLQLTEAPVIKRFFREHDPRSVKYSSYFYDMVNEADQIYKTVNKYMKYGRRDDARELIDDNRELLQKRKGLNRYKRQISEINRTMDKIARSSLAPAIKDARNRKLQQQKNRLQKRAVEIYGEGF